MSIFEVLQRRNGARSRRAQTAPPELDRHRRLAEHSATLSRLSHRIQLLHARRATGLQLRAAQNAYDDTLLIAAREIGLTVTSAAPLQALDRLTLEAELSLAGLRWTTTH